jgi:sterol desaturase/sphingolipid hydroxylase (fatty acid hydroxylase superfamily)
METLRQLQFSLPPFALDLVRLGVWLVILALIFVPLEKFFTLRPQKIFRRAFSTDLAYYFLNGILLKLLLVLPLTLVAWGVRHVLPDGHSWAADIPLWIRIVAALVVGEIGSYWGHRWMHQIPVLWRFHAIHHSAEEIDWLVNTRAHPLDMVFTRLCGLTPMYLLGLAQPTGNKLDIVPLIVVLFGTVWSFFIHANVRLRLVWLQWLISTPAFHHWHHTQLGPDQTTKNYAATLPWVDKVFGTYYLPKQQWPVKYGIDSVVAPDLVGQILHPLAPKR